MRKARWALAMAFRTLVAGNDHGFRQRGKAMKISRRVTTAVWSVVVMLLLAVPGAAQDPVIFEDHFDTDTGIRTQFWSLWTNQPNFVVDDSGGDVFFHNPYGGIGWGHFEDISLCFKGRLSGDFDVSVRFDNLHLDPTPAGCNEASLGVFFGGQDLGLTQQNCADSETQTIGVWVGPPDEWQNLQASDAASGLLRIVRTGPDVAAYLHEGPIDPGDEPILSGQYNSEQVTGLCFRLATWGSEGKVSARFDDFTVTAKTIEYPTAQWRKSVATTTFQAPGRHDIGLGFHPEGREVAIAYTDPDTEELRVVRGAPDGPTWSWEVPEVVSPEGHTVDLAYDNDGDLWLSFLVGAVKRVTANMAHWDSLDQTWSQRKVERGVKRWDTSMAHFEGTSGWPAMTYGMESGHFTELKFFEGELPPVVVDSGASGERNSSSLTYDPDGAPAVAYSYLGLDGRRSIKFASRSSGAWIPDVNLVDDCEGRRARGVSLAFQKKIPVVAFTDTSSAPLDFCERSDGWVCKQLNVGPFSYPSIVVDDQDIVTVSASKWGSLYLYSRPSDPAAEWHTERIGGAGGGDSAIDPRGNPAFGFWLGSELGLAYLHPGICDDPAHCDDANPCTEDTCPSGVCEHEFLADGAVCGGPSERCCAGLCLTRYGIGGDCDDGDDCTKDIHQPGKNPPCSSYCEHVPYPDCLLCIPTHSKEKGPRCSDGLDNDCDGLIDDEDTDC